MSFKLIAAMLVAVLLTGCAGARLGVAPNGRFYGEVAIAPQQGQAQYRPRPMVQVPGGGNVVNNNVIVQQGGGSYQQPTFCANYHNGRGQSCYGGGIRRPQQQRLVKECRPHGRGQMCHMVPEHMVGR